MKNIGFAGCVLIASWALIKVVVGLPIGDLLTSAFFLMTVVALSEGKE